MVETNPGQPASEKPAPGSQGQGQRVWCPEYVEAADLEFLARQGGPAGGWRKFVTEYRLACLLVPLGSLVVFSSLFVGTDIVLHNAFPYWPTAWRHALLTGCAAVVTALSSGLVCWMAHRQNRQLSSTAERLAKVIGTYQTHRGTTERFDNPYLVFCRDVLGCQKKECPMYNAPGQRCWQVMALKRARTKGGDIPQIELEQCLECEVYRRSCPDKLTELGESFNNLMFLLEQEARQVGAMHAQMIEKEKMVAVGQIAAGVAHEIGNPLSSISSIVQMLKRKGSPGAVGRELDLIETHIQRISGTVRQLVSMARPGTDRWELVDISKTLEEAVRLIAFDRRARNVEIRLEPTNSLPATYGLRGELQQVFINLALNALDAMPEGGRLTFRARTQQERIIVDVEDTGCGIPEEIGRRVFEPFFTTKEPGQGTGLGLAVSYGIVRKHGGEIGLRSTVGEGTVFTVELPILNKPPGG